jgi:excisionase family DNA binding protein
VRYAADITPPRYGSLAEAAEYLGCNERTVRRYIAAGKLRGYRLGGLLRVDLNEVDAAMAPIPTAGGGHGAA